MVNRPTRGWFSKAVNSMSSTPLSSYLVPVAHLGIQTAEALCAPLLEHCKLDRGALIDLSAVETYDPIGVQLLYSCQKTSIEAGQPFAVMNAAPTLMQLMDSLGLRPETLRGVSPEAGTGQDKSVSVRGGESD